MGLTEAEYRERLREQDGQMEATADAKGTLEDAPTGSYDSMN